MRNLKRALSLTLASVMLLGMMVVGAGAVGYSDVTKEENIEAIEVLQKVGVMSGVDEDHFNPDGYVTREQMAVIMSKLLNLDYDYYEGTNPFSDVPAWAAKYVAACAANGITSGIGNGMYGAGQNVNAVQAALMMLKALGYFQYQQDFGDDYVLATVKQATEIGLFNQIESNAQSALTRNEVAQMALNALKSDLVRFTGDVGSTIPTANGNVVIGYKAEYTPRTSTDPKFNRLIDNKHSSDIDHSGQYYCQLGEELYNGDLVQRYDSDIFQRPSYTWTYKTEMIGTYVDKTKFLASYDSGVKGRTLYDLLNNITIKEYTLETYVDGHIANNTGVNGTNYASQYNYENGSADEYIDKDKDLVRSNDKNVGITANGVETEVYLDRDNKIITIVSMHTWLANGSTDYTEAKETASMKIYLTDHKGLTKVVDVDDVPEVTGVAKDGWYLVKMSDKDTKMLEVAEIMEPTILTDSTVTKFTQSGGAAATGRVTKLTTGGNEYKNNVMAYYDEEVLGTYNDNLLTNASYNVYLDQNGYFVGVDLFEGSKNYVFITGYDMGNSNLSVKTAQASGIFLDGTMKTMTVDVTNTNKNIDKLYVDHDSNVNTPKVNLSAYYIKWDTHASKGVYTLNRWYTYTESDGVYTLKPCYYDTRSDDGIEILMMASEPASGDLTLKCDQVRLDSVAAGDTSTAEKLFLGETRKYTDGTYATDDSTTIASSAYNKVHKARAYGEDDSIFITVETDNVSATAGGVTRAITDVKGVYTGVQNVELISESTDRIKGDTVASDHPAVVVGSNVNFGERVYTVYDKDHFIIGSVILGSAKGGVENYAYILNPVKSEERRDADGYYYWEFEAVVKGEIVTLTAKTKYENTILTLKDNRYKIVELRMDGEYVTSVAELDYDDIYGKNAGGYGAGQGFNEIKSNIGNENVYDVILDDDSIWTNRLGRETVSTTAADPRGSVLSFQGNTMYVLADRSDVGLALSKDAKAVVRQVESGDWKNTEFTSVESAVAWLADADNNPDNGKQFHGVITAVLNSKGVAEWVVFYTDTELVAGANREPSTSAGDMTIKWEYSLDGGVNWIPVNQTDILKASVYSNGDIVNVPTPTIAGKYAAPVPVVFAAGTTQTLRAIYGPRSLDHISVNTPAGVAEVKFGTDMTKAQAVAAGLVITAHYDNGETVDVTADAGATLTDGHEDADLTAGADGTPGTATVQVTYSGKTANATIKYEKYAEVSALTDFSGVGDIASDYTVTSSLGDIASAVKVKAGDTFTITYTADTKGATTLKTGTQSAAVTGATPTTITTTLTNGCQMVVTNGTGDASTGTAATVVVTIKVATITAGAISVATTVDN